MPDEKKKKMKSSSRSGTAGKKELSFEKALERLTEIVETLEGGEPSLERSLALFEEGAALSRQCNVRLDAADRRLEILVERHGEQTVEEFSTDEDAS